MNDITHSTPESEISMRIQRFQTHLKNREMECALILQNSDLYYFAGTIQQSVLYIPAQGEPLLMVKKSHERAMAESPLQKTCPMKSPKRIPDILKEHGYEMPKRIGMELDVLPAMMLSSFQHIFKSASIDDVSHDIRLVRSIKSDYELGLIKKAAGFSDLVAEAVPGILKKGMTEIELAGLVEAKARSLGHQGIVRMRLWGAELFYGHIMSGPSAAVPSYLASPTGGASVSPAVAQGPCFRKIQANEPVLVDYVFAWKGYLSDHTRIFSIGRLPDELLSAHAAMLELQHEIIQMAKPGVEAGRVYETAVEKAGKSGYLDHFMGTGKDRIRFVGHGIGLELDEYPFLAKGQKLILEKGMVIALEPKLIFPGKGVVGIENTHVMTESGLEQLTRFNENITQI